MRGHTLIDDPGESVLSHAGAALSVPQLVQRLVRQVLSAPLTAPRKYDMEGREILLDTEVDGMRCLLVRVPCRPEHEQGSPVTISPREQEIARMVAKGYPTKTVAAVLDISSWTVNTYLRRIFAKLGVSSRAAMVERLHQEGIWTDVDSPTGSATNMQR